MARSFKPGILVTISAGSLLACSGLGHKSDGEGPPIGNPPPRPSTVDAKFPTAPFYEGQSLEARVEGKGEIHHGSGSCWIDLPFPEPPTSWRPPPTQQVDCPEGYTKDPAYAECDGGSIHLRALTPTMSCVCYYDGNPPPSPKDVSCPVTAIPELMAAASQAHQPSANPPAIPEVPK